MEKRTKDDFHAEGFFEMKITLVIAIIVLGVIACIGSGSSSGSGPSESNNSSQSQSRSGWLCDFDKTGTVRLWSSASMQATVKDIVGVYRGGCVDVTMLEYTSVEGILFYSIRVGAQSGWVDVDYYYNFKPSWSTN